MAMQERSVNLVKLLIERIIKNPDSLRYDTLTFFGEKHGITYDRSKELMEALAYATQAIDLRRVPKTQIESVKNIREELRKGTISIEEAGKAVDFFMKRTPKMDVDRILRVLPTKNRRTIRGIQKMAATSEETMKLMVEYGIPAPRAYGVVWVRPMGKMLHHELQEILDKVPKKKVRSVVRNLAGVNRLKAIAQLHYTSADLGLRDLMRSYLNRPQSRPTTLPRFMNELGVKDASKYDQKLQNIQKGFRYPRLGAERPMPRQLKTHLKRRYSEYEGARFKAFPANPFDQVQIIIGEDLKKGDKSYAKAKQAEEQRISPFVQISKKKRRR